MIAERVSISQAGNCHGTNRETAPRRGAFPPLVRAGLREGSATLGNRAHTVPKSGRDLVEQAEHCDKSANQSVVLSFPMTQRIAGHRGKSCDLAKVSLFTPTNGTAKEYVVESKYSDS